MYKFEKLKVWQESVELIFLVYSFCKSLPKSEERNLIDQLIRSATSVSLNIAEGSGSDSDIEFKRYLGLSRKSLYEVVAILKIAEKLYNLNIQDIILKVEVVGKMLSGLINSLKIKSPKAQSQEPRAKS
ncbi:MAG TPA: four helix bundle protein [Candidatus Woesebacteria bacterium]|nr:four helix bundle protein [Candidatus Woesebacteria bacterium]